MKCESSKISNTHTHTLDESPALPVTMLTPRTQSPLKTLMPLSHFWALVPVGIP